MHSRLDSGVATLLFAGYVNEISRYTIDCGGVLSFELFELLGLI